MASASAQLGIAKASLFAALLKPDAGLPSCSRDDIEQFHGLLSAAVAQCSPTNVQKCKQWTLQHMISSPARVAALGRYLVAFANSFGSQQQQQQQQKQQQAGGGPNKKGPPGPSVKRRRLHLLYVLSDVFFHVKFRTKDQTFFADIEPHVLPLIRSAAAFTNAPKHQGKLNDLVEVWEEKAYFSGSVLEKLRAAVAEGPTKVKDNTEANGETATQKETTASSARDAPFLLPSMHGDASTPWYDLPAANWLPAIEPNSTRPMNPSMIKPLQLAGGPADKNLVEAVKKLLGEVDKIYAKDTRLDGDSVVDINQMGEIIERDELGDIVGGETYYGWSRAFCEKMRARRKKGDAMDIDDDGRGRRRSSRSSSRSWSRSRGRSPSRDSSRPAMKRRRISGSRSRSVSRGGSRGLSGQEELQPAATLTRLFTLRVAVAPALSFSTAWAPSTTITAAAAHFNQQLQQQPPPPPFQPNWSVPPPPPQQQQQQQQQQQYPPNQPGGFDAWNAPPPPPPHYQGHNQGHWPPPPPPPPLGMSPAGNNSNSVGHPPQGWFPPPPNASSPPVPVPPPSSWGQGGGWGPPVPPPPPPPSGHPPQQQPGGGFHQGGGGGYQQYGRGGNGNYRGRGGGYGRGRGW
ncbi:hypothetical protein SLS53_008654 [Cytospora paraplurivora]|uniref:CID domain-containing protein n=1 Tax=Cytospora paraplurivora TaxID=2898453 RepID=A0AAN9U0J0_9PEZI